MNLILKSLLSSKNRLFDSRKEFITKYNKMINSSLNIYKNINFKGVVKNRNKKLLEDAEGLKNFKSNEKLKIKLQESLNNENLFFS